MRQVITREVALTEAYLDHQALLSQPSFPRVSAREWASEIAKAVVWFVGLVLIIFSMAILAPESRGDTIKVSTIASELDQESVLPLAGGVDVQLANNLIQAQNAAWGKQWFEGSLELSIESVLKAIGLYVWDGGPTEITKDQTAFQVVWIQSHIAIDPRLTVGFDTEAINFGEQPVSTPEPMTLVLVLMGLVWLGVVRWSNRQSMADRIRGRLLSYRVR
jgi:hypothetical protein